MTTENESVISDVTNGDETATEETKKARDIGVLLELDTYQGMTDEEIDKVFAYKLYQELSNAKIKVLYNDVMEANAERTANAERMLQLAEEQLELVKNKQFVLKKVNVNG